MKSKKKDLKKLITRIFCFALAALMVISVAYMAIYLILIMF